MQDLILTENCLEPSNGGTLASTLHVLPRLRHLDLSCCRITDEFCNEVAPALCAATTLTYLNLRGNRVKEEGSQAIGLALVTPHTRPSARFLIPCYAMGRSPILNRGNFFIVNSNEEHRAAPPIVASLTVTAQWTWWPATE